MEFDPTQRIQILMLSDSPSAIAHGTTAGHSPKQTPTKSPNFQNLIICVHTITRPNPWARAIRIDCNSAEGCLPTSRIPQHDHLSVSADPNKGITTP